jgi:hypothetical protein
MNLQENIHRIKEVMGLKEEVENTDNFEISYIFNPKVVELQKKLKDLNYDLGNFGPNKDGVDGKYGIMTRAAHLSFQKGLTPSEFETNKETIIKNVVPKMGGENIIIGDSQTPFVDMNTTKASRISTEPGMSSLWQGGKGVSWLIDALSQFQESPEISNVVIVIGTNGNFGKYNDNISLLFELLRTKFPNANFYAVQGSWGWGGLKNTQEKNVREYYKKFAREGATIIEPPIGKIEPHGNKPVYAEIGAAIDSLL